MKKGEIIFKIEEFNLYSFSKYDLFEILNKLEQLEKRNKLKNG